MKDRSYVDSHGIYINMSNLQAEFLCNGRTRAFINEEDGVFYYAFDIGFSSVLPRHVAFDSYEEALAYAKKDWRSRGHSFREYRRTCNEGVA